MIKKVLVIIVIIFFSNNTFAQKYYKIEGTSQVFTYYGKKRSEIINDSVTVFYYVKGENFYLALKVSNTPLSKYSRYRILTKKNKERNISLGRGGNKRTIFIQVNLVKPEKIDSNVQFIKHFL